MRHTCHQGSALPRSRARKKAEKIVKPLGAAAVSRLQLGGHLPGIWLVAATGTVQADLTGNAQGFVIATHRLWPSF